MKNKIEELEKKKIKSIIDDCANQTDIWDNERWDKTKRLLYNSFKELLNEAKKGQDEKVKKLKEALELDYPYYEDMWCLIDKIFKNQGEEK